MGRKKVIEILKENGKEGSIDIFEPLFNKIIPQGWVELVSNLTEKEKEEFIIKDNLDFGEWDITALSKWDSNSLGKWGLELSFDKIEGEEDFERKFNQINDSNCIHPLVPIFDEDHEVVIIICDSEVDLNWLREKFGMQKMKSYKNSEVSKSNIIHVNDLKNVL